MQPPQVCVFNGVFNGDFNGVFNGFYFSGSIRSGIVFDDMSKPEALNKSNRNSFGAKKPEVASAERPTKAKIRFVS